MPTRQPIEISIEPTTPYVDPSVRGSAQKAHKLEEAVNANLGKILTVLNDFHVAVVTFKDEKGAPQVANVVDTGSGLLMPGDSRVKGDRPVMASIPTDKAKAAGFDLSSAFLGIRIGVGNVLNYSPNLRDFPAKQLPLERIIKVEVGPSFADHDTGEVVPEYLALTA